MCLGVKGKGDRDRSPSAAMGIGWQSCGGRINFAAEQNVETRRSSPRLARPLLIYMHKLMLHLPINNLELINLRRLCEQVVENSTEGATALIAPSGRSWSQGCYVNLFFFFDKIASCKQRERIFFFWSIVKILSLEIWVVVFFDLVFSKKGRGRVIGD